MTNGEPKKLYLLPNGLISYCRTSDEDIEYTHTDALINKACEWLEENADKHIHGPAYMFYKESMIEKFKEAMKGGNNE